MLTLGPSGLRITDWEFRDYNDPVMGSVKSKARWTDPSSVEDSEFLGGDWANDGKEQVEAFVEGVGSGWTAHQVTNIMVMFYCFCNPY